MFDLPIMILVAALALVVWLKDRGDDDGDDSP